LYRQMFYVVIFLGRVFGQAVSCRPLTAENQFRFQPN